MPVIKRAELRPEGYDYIVCGAGSAGATLAGRLSEDPDVSVLLLEAGGTDRHWTVRVPAMAVINMTTKKRNWAFETVPQKELNDRRGFQPRGKVLGGSSSLNAMIYIRGDKTDYDAWAEAGNPGWAYADVLPYFRKSEHHEEGADAYHGTGGPLNVAPVNSPARANETFIRAAEELQIRRNPDFNGERLEGAGLFEVTQKNGERWNTARAFLDPVEDRPNLHILTHALVEKVCIKGGRATGVRLRVKKDAVEVAAREEIILSGGAFGSPHMLLLSGIGARDKLEPHGIEVVHELPGVGENLQDHVDYCLIYKTRDRDLIGFSAGAFRDGIKHITQWHKTRDGSGPRGLFSSNYAESGAFVTVDADEPAPDIQYHFVRSAVDDHGRKLHWGHGYSLHVCVLRPKSRGTVELASSDPAEPPRIDPNYFGEAEDLDKLVRGVRLGQRIMASDQFKDLYAGSLYATEAEDEDTLRADIRARSDTIYHPVGTCKMGPESDPLAVVDARLRVHGLEGLRVADASIMPTLVSGNTNAPSIMIGEKAADMIRDDRARKAEHAPQVLAAE